MSYYLDTSIVRKCSKNLEELSNKYALRTSCLTVFELISGITETDFWIRRASVQNLINNKLIKIDWDFYNIKQYRAFKINYCNEDGLAVKDFAYKLAESKSYSEFKNFECKRAEKNYSLDVFSCFDKSVDCNSEIIASCANQLLESMSKDDKKALRNDLKKTLLQQVQVNQEILISNMALALTNSDSRCDKEYLVAISNYDKSLDLFFSYTHLYSILSKWFGKKYGNNDIFDLCHFIYLKEGDSIVSDDSIFKYLNDYLSKVKVFTSEELQL